MSGYGSRVLLGKRRGPLTPSAARSIGLVIAVAAGFSGLIAAAVAVAALVRARPAPEVAFLLIPAIPLVVVGQVWAILSIRRSKPPRSPNRWGRRPVATSSWNPRRFLFGSLDTRVSAALLVTAFLGWLLAMTAFPTLAGGQPGGHTATCAYVLSNHGSNMCVSRSAYLRAGAAEQRFASGILLAFFAVHCGAALGTRHVTANPASDPPD